MPIVVFVSELVFPAEPLRAPAETGVRPPRATAKQTSLAQL
jgi:hypothetical protein